MNVQKDSCTEKSKKQISENYFFAKFQNSESQGVATSLVRVPFKYTQTVKYNDGGTVFPESVHTQKAHQRCRNNNLLFQVA